MGTLHDAVNWRQCPKPAALYIDGLYAASPSAFAVGDLRITVKAADWLQWRHLMQDCEPGNVGPVPCADSATRRLAAGLCTYPYINKYANDWLDIYVAQLRSHGVDLSPPGQWATEPDGKAGIYWIGVEADPGFNYPDGARGGVPHLNPAQIATQFQEEAVGPQGQRFDLSMTLGNFPFPPVITPPVVIPPVVLPPVHMADTAPPVPVTLGAMKMSMIASKTLFTTDANGWHAEDVTLPAGKTAYDIISIPCDAASAYDTQGWHFCEAQPDFASGSTAANVARIVFMSKLPNDSFSWRVYVAD